MVERYVRQGHHEWEMEKSKRHDLEDPSKNGGINRQKAIIARQPWF
jgi:hypothetical protein